MQAHGEDFCKNAEKSEIFNEKWILRRAVFHEIVLKVRSLGDGPVMVLLLTSLFYVQNFIAAFIMLTRSLMLSYFTLS